MPNKTTGDPREINKFNELSLSWWDKDGPLKTLHDINPLRLSFITQEIALTGQRILDVGCGGGILTESLAGEGAQMTGLDASPEAIRIAKEHQPSIHYVCCLLEDYEAPVFDHIVCMELLEHVADPAHLIAHCARLLKPGGTLFLSTINRTLTAYGAAIIGAEYLLGLLPRQTHDFEKFMKPAEVASILRHSDFSLNRIQGFSYNPLTRNASFSPSVAVNYLLSSSLAG